MSKSYIEVEAFVSSEQEIYCKDCARRKGIKNGKEQFIYEIGDASCKACGIMDVLDDVEAYSEAFPADVKPVVRGKWLDGRCTNCAWELPDYEYYGGYEIGNVSCDEFNFCPDCGADMRKEENDER